LVTRPPPNIVSGVSGRASAIKQLMHPATRGRIVAKAGSAATRASLLVTPRLAAWRHRREFAAGGLQMAHGLDKHAPAGVEMLSDERYGPGADMLLDVYRPAANDSVLPVYIWVHGGGWFAGTKEERAGYFKLIASKGYAVISPRYSLSPAQRYPTPARQIMQALTHLQADATRLRLDMARIVIGGDSAGGQIAAQIGALVTAPPYVLAVGVAPTITPDQLKGLVLACGFYDLSLYAADGLDRGHRRLLKAELWSYSGRRQFMADSLFSTISVTDYVTAAFPPALITVGNDDPLDIHTQLLIDRLRAAGAEPETVLFSPDHRPLLGHEYQFALDTDDGQLFLQHTLAFLHARL
jgi:acetyl esterase/lipase